MLRQAGASMTRAALPAAVVTVAAFGLDQVALLEESPLVGSPCQFGCPPADGETASGSGRLVFGHDYRFRTPRWVAERFSYTPVSREQRGVRSVRFLEDASTPSPFRSKPAHFHQSGFSRGHMAPAMNHNVSQAVMDETFTLGNIAPQLARFNQGPWQQLEQFALQVSKLYEEVVILTGPLYLAPETIPSDRIPLMMQSGGGLANTKIIDNNDKSPAISKVQHAVIGDAPNTVAVPTHFFKVLLARRPIGRPDAESSDTVHNTAIAAFVLPHSEAIPGGVCDLGMYVVSLQRLEQAMGGLLFDNALCSDAKRLIDEQATARGLGAGVRFAAWAMIHQHSTTLADSSSFLNLPIKGFRVDPSTPNISLASPLPVASLALRDPQTPSLVIANSDPSSTTVKPRWRKRRSKQIDNPISAAVCMREQYQRQQQMQRDDESTWLADVTALDSNLATELGQVIHLCSVVQCGAPKRVKQTSGGPVGRFHPRVRWRGSNEHDYNRQWLDKILQLKQQQMVPVPGISSS